MNLRYLNPLLIVFVLIAVLGLGLQPAQAQNAPSESAYYVVQYGDTLWDIALRFRLTVDELVAANSLANAGQINVGDAIRIPGLKGVQGRLVTLKVPYGESLVTLGRRYNTSPQTLASLNGLSSPHQLYAGFDLIIPEEQASAAYGSRISLQPGESLLELAVRTNTNPYQLTHAWQAPTPWAAMPGQVLFAPGEDSGGPGS
jgi:LysM repeat protein